MKSSIIENKSKIKQKQNRILIYWDGHNWVLTTHITNTLLEIRDDDDDANILTANFVGTANRDSSFILWLLPFLLILFFLLFYIHSPPTLHTIHNCYRINLWLCTSFLSLSFIWCVSSSQFSHPNQTVIIITLNRRINNQHDDLMLDAFFLYCYRVWYLTIDISLCWWVKTAGRRLMTRWRRGVVKFLEDTSAKNNIAEEIHKRHKRKCFRDYLVSHKILCSILFYLFLTPTKFTFHVFARKLFTPLKKEIERILGIYLKIVFSHITCYWRERFATK